ncbi:MAG: hypothetical protein VYE77_02090 [Planctomycetota bacterium]|nr:hypothetical protein [Planctomycetota bacterium]
MFLRRFVAISVLLAAGSEAPLAAQGLILPDSHGVLEGSTATNVPFGRSTPTRVQCVYDSSLFASPGQISSIAWRLDGGASAATKLVDCEIRMSTGPQVLVNTSALFSANRGVDEVVVLPRQIVQLSGQSIGTTPTPFLPPIALATPFAYDPAHGPLVVEVIVYAQPPGSYSLDATFVCTSPEFAVGPVACTPLVGQPLRCESATTQLLWGRPWLARVLDAAPGSLVTMVLGTRDTGTWNGFVLPQDLGMLGAPGCYLSIDMGATFFQTALGDGSATFTFAIPNQPSALGIWLYYQAGAVAPGANALGVITSQARRVQVGGFEPVARVWSSGITSLVGVREMGTAPVIEISYP